MGFGQLIFFLFWSNHNHFPAKKDVFHYSPDPSNEIFGTRTQKVAQIGCNLCLRLFVTEQNHCIFQKGGMIIGRDRLNFFGDSLGEGGSLFGIK